MLLCAAGKAEGEESGADKGRGPRIYVGGIPTAVSETMVRNHFSQWGQVTFKCPLTSKGRVKVDLIFVSTVLPLSKPVLPERHMHIQYTLNSTL